MMRRFNVIRLPLALCMAMALAACSARPAKKEPGNIKNHPEATVQTPAFKKYWYAGKGEVSHYNLQQIRYGQIHEGKAIMVFVTENFLTGKQVKLESPAKGRSTATVMKLNFLREFVTGIYKYNTMTSVFTPVEIKKRPHSLKVSSYAQEWCGIWYAQLNLHDAQYTVTGHSYFEDEADYSKKLDAYWLEDELWTKLRLNPDLLPEGEINIIPGSFAVRRSHAGWTIEKAVTKKQPWSGKDMPGQNLMAYSVDYKNNGRKLTLIYENESPYRIAGWIETQKMKNGKTLTARSVRTKTIKQAYWKEHHKSDKHLRSNLGLNN